jgi:UPF0716 protein FxsA
MPGLVLFLLLFVGAPLLELYLLIEVGTRIGAIPTIALSVFTAVLGGLLVRWQGLAVLFRVREAVERDQVPALELLEGAVLLVAGLLLLLPGLITDSIGFLLLIGPLRRGLIVAWLKRRGVLGPGGGIRPGSGRQARDYLEGDFRRED